MCESHRTVRTTPLPRWWLLQKVRQEVLGAPPMRGGQGGAVRRAGEVLQALMRDVHCCRVQRCGGTRAGA